MPSSSQSKATLSLHAGILNGGCGMGYLSGYEYLEPALLKQYPWMRREGQTVDSRPGGCGWISGAFVNTPVCKDVWERLSAKYELEYCTPIRNNRNSGRDFCFAIWDTKKKIKKPRASRAKKETSCAVAPATAI